MIILDENACHMYGPCKFISFYIKASCIYSAEHDDEWTKKFQIYSAIWLVASLSY